MNNVLSIDLESWIHFYLDALKKNNFLSSSEKKIMDGGYICEATEKILDLLDKYQSRATFFVVSEIYDWYPNLIEEIRKRGHEIGYHTYDHAVLFTRKILEEQFEKSRLFIENFRPIGFRAPHIFVTEDSLAFLKKHGFFYSSSTYDEREKRLIAGMEEIAVSTIAFRHVRTGFNNKLPQHLTFGLITQKIPFGSGLFISLFGRKITYFIDSFNQKGIPVVLFLHPWQLFKHKNIKGISFSLKLLRNNPLCLPYLRNLLPTFKKLLETYKFISFKEYYYEH